MQQSPLAVPIQSPPGLPLQSPTSPRRKWLVKTQLRRDLHPMAVNSHLALATSRHKQLASNTESPQWSKTNNRHPPVQSPHASTSSPRHHNSHLLKHPPAEADLKVQQQLIHLLKEKHLHNRYLDYADKDGDGEIDTDFSKSKDRHYNTTPILSPKRKPFSPALFPGSETLHFVNDIHLLQTSRPKLALLTSPQWNGHRINPASFSAPPGLKNQAPLGSTIQGPLKIVPFLASTRRRQQLQKHSKWENETKWQTKYRKHRTDFQKDKSAAIRDGLKDQTYRRRWTGPSDHFYHGFLARHHHGCYGDSSNGKQIE